VSSLISAALIYVNHESFRVGICVDLTGYAIANSQMRSIVGDDVASETLGDVT